MRTRLQSGRSTSGSALLEGLWGLTLLLALLIAALHIFAGTLQGFAKAVQWIP